KFINPSIGFFLAIIICWIVQVLCLMLIIVNRLCILIQQPSQRVRHLLFFSFEISKLTVSFRIAYTQARGYRGCFCRFHFYVLWDKFEKAIYLLLDLALNILFIRMVKSRLVDHGLKKYDRVMRFNQRIIIVSIGMDILLMGATTLKNRFVYTQFHPVTYIVKLQIEMSMSCLLIKVAQSTGIDVYNTKVSGQTGQRTQGAVYVLFFITSLSGLIRYMLQGRQHHDSDSYPV
ncbi:hypothetical protein ARMSODRAFT_1039975, partial [Armillaria solidipes]